jgi:hypothetical protein
MMSRFLYPRRSGPGLGLVRCGFRERYTFPDPLPNDGRSSSGERNHCLHSLPRNQRYSLRFNMLVNSHNLRKLAP